MGFWKHFFLYTLFRDYATPHNFYLCISILFCSVSAFCVLIYSRARAYALHRNCLSFRKFIVTPHRPYIYSRWTCFSFFRGERQRHLTYSNTNRNFQVDSVMEFYLDINLLYDVLKMIAFYCHFLFVETQAKLIQIDGCQRNILMVSFLFQTIFTLLFNQNYNIFFGCCWILRNSLKLSHLGCL